MSSRKKNLLAGGPKRFAATTSASSLNVTLKTSASSSTSNDSQQLSSLRISNRTSPRKKKTALIFDKNSAEPPVKKQKSNAIISSVRSSPRKLSGNQNQYSTHFAATSPSKRRHKERPTTPVPEHIAKESKLHGAVVTQMLNNSIPEEDDGGNMEVDVESRIGYKRRPSRVMVDDTLNQVKKMKIATPAKDEIDPNCTVNLRSQQPLGKTFKKQRRINSSIPTQRISSQQMIVFPQKQ